MKYFKFLIIPIFMIMFIVPVKALDNADNLPYWVTSGDYYLVFEKQFWYNCYCFVPCR